MPVCYLILKHSKAKRYTSTSYFFATNSFILEKNGSKLGFEKQAKLGLPASYFCLTSTNGRNWHSRGFLLN